MWWGSIILDSTQDITKIDQVSIIIRHVFVEYENHTLDTRESFLGFFALQNHGSCDYAELLLKILTKFGLDIKKMSYSGLWRSFCNECCPFCIVKMNY